MKRLRGGALALALVSAGPFALAENPAAALLDLDGKATEPYAPPGVLPDLPRNQVPIAANLIIDREGRIRFYSLLDSANFDAKLIQKAKLDEMPDAEP